MYQKACLFIQCKKKSGKIGTVFTFIIAQAFIKIIPIYKEGGGCLLGLRCLEISKILTKNKEICPKLKKKMLHTATHMIHDITRVIQ